MNRRRRARNGLLSGLASFVALQLVLGGVLAFGPWPFLTDPYYGYKAYLLKQRLKGHAERPYTVLMLGSSRTYSGLETARLEQPLADALGRPVVAFNFAVNAAGAGHSPDVSAPGHPGGDASGPGAGRGPSAAVGRSESSRGPDRTALAPSFLHRDELALMKHYVGADARRSSRSGLRPGRCRSMVIEWRCSTGWRLCCYRMATTRGTSR